MNASSIKLGVVVRDVFGRTGIVLTRKPEPDQEWIDDQVNSADIKRLGPTEWWGVMPLDGGFARAPGPLLNYLREATYEDFLLAADNANIAGRKYLVKVFPNYVDQLLAERRSMKSNED